mgnify:CR=1 FL=1
MLFRNKWNKMKVQKNVVIIFMLFLTGNNIFSEKITDYVNKKDVQNVNRIFIYREEKRQKKEELEKGSIKNKNEENNTKTEKTEEKNNGKETPQKTVNEKIGEVELEYRDVKEISEKLDGLSGFKIVGIDNKVILHGDEKKMEEVRRIIKDLDRPKEQVIIKGRIIDTSSNLFERLGVDWSASTDNQTPAKTSLIAKFLNGEVSIGSIFSSGGKFLGVDFNLLRENGDIKIEAMPTLMIMENEEGELKVTEEVIVGEKKITKNNEDYIEPIFSEAGIVFRILPEIKKIKKLVDYKKIIIDKKNLKVKIDKNPLEIILQECRKLSIPCLKV